jgi:aspartate oxidase
MVWRVCAEPAKPTISIRSFPNRSYWQTGGNGQVYRTNVKPNPLPPGMEGWVADGVPGPKEALARIMEFIQFHPTALYDPGVKGTNLF